jgi:ABC-type multidrug transport system fused ATPase/permease subunit
MLVAWGVYAYRDLYPLITYSKHPMDPDYLPQPVVWTRFSLLTIVGVLIPAFQPSQYRPVDPINPADEPNPEQTASFFSYVFYFFMDRLIIKAWTKKTIPYDELPPLPDYDRAAWLAKNSLLKLHPIRRQELGLPARHLFICLVSVYWKTYLVLALMIFIKAVMEFAVPIGINRLLTYIQSGDSGDIRPWFWILWLFLGPTVASMAWQYYIFTTTRSLVHVESLFTQLLFGHALRIKMQDPVDTTAAKGGDMKGANTPAIVEDEQPTGVVSTHTPVVNNGPVQADDAESSTTASQKREGSVDSGKKAEDAKGEDETEQASGLVGRLTTLASTDLENIVEGRDILMAVLYAPLQLVLGAIFLYQILSWSALVGMGVTFVTLPIPGYLAKLMNSTQQNLMKATDNRIQTITEAVNTLRMVKLFAWERKISERISEKRAAELRQIRRKSFIDRFTSTVNWMLPILTMIAAYGLYTGVQKQTLTAAKVFSSLTVFDMIRNQMFTMTQMIQAAISAKVSIGRVDNFLRSTELLDEYKEEVTVQIKSVPEQGKVYFKNAEFAWEKPSSRSIVGTATASKEWKLRIDDLEFPAGKTTIVAGKTSSGKTSLLMALLGEMNWAPTQLDSSFNLPRAGGVAYAAQEAWVMATTVRQNIVFGEEFDEERYKRVLHVCALEKDLELFDAGDQTELGEKGLNAR